MAINPLQIGDLNASLLHAGYQGEVIVAKEHATEVTMFPDNLNNQLAQNTLPMGVWNPSPGASTRATTARGPTTRAPG